MQYQIFNEKETKFEGYHEIVNPKIGDIFSFEKRTNSNTQAELVQLKIVSVDEVMIVAKEVNALGW